MIGTRTNAEKREALLRWDRHLERLVTGRKERIESGADAWLAPPRALQVAKARDTTASLPAPRDWAVYVRLVKSHRFQGTASARTDPEMDALWAERRARDGKSCFFESIES